MMQRDLIRLYYSIRPYLRNSSEVVFGDMALKNDNLKNHLEILVSLKTLPKKESFLSKYVKTKYMNLDLSKYSFKFHKGADYFYDSAYNEMYGDTRHQFILSHNHECEDGSVCDEFIAFLGFEFYPKLILVSQIQGVKGKQEFLKSFKWSKALLNVAIDFANEVEIPEIGVLPSKRSKWTSVRYNENGAKMYYDVTAKREGFKYDEEMGIYVKKL